MLLFFVDSLCYMYSILVISHFACQISLTHIASLELRKIAEVVDEHHTLRTLLVNMDIENMNTLKDLLSFLLDIENMRGLARQLTTQRAK